MSSSGLVADVTITAELHAKHLSAVMAAIPTALARLEWSSERIAAYRQEQLRELVRHAVEKSPWHAKRLAGIDATKLTEADVANIPTMTKNDLMEHWDEIVTDPRLSLEACEAHLEAMIEHTYLLDEYTVVASGGSSGMRGVFVFSRDELTALQSVLARPWLWSGRKGTIDWSAPWASVSARHPTHMSAVLSQLFGVGEGPALSADMPLAEIVEGLNGMQPGVLIGYASVLGLLVGEARAGRLRIAPQTAMPASEPLLPEIAEGIREVWGATVLNLYASSEAGLMAFGCGDSDAMHVCDDMVMLEPVDDEGRPVATGDWAAKVFITPLYLRTLPLIRYEVSDEVLPIAGPCACGCSFSRIADVRGRSEDAFRFRGDVVVLPHVLRQPIGRCRAVVDYQVRQTTNGADVLVSASGPFDVNALARELAEALRGVRVQGADVRVLEVQRIDRGSAGKLKRFVPLGA